MYHNGARYSTVRGLLSAVANTLRLKPGLEHLGTDPVVTSIFPAMRRADIKRPGRDLGWDLDVVLHYLAGLHDPTNILWVTYKALFLLAFSSGARISELAALRFPLFMSEQGVTIPFDTVFIPKRTRATAAHSSLPPLHISCLPRADEAICPVVALRCYADLLGNPVEVAPLWRHPSKPAVITTRHLAAWLRATIAAAYRVSGQSAPSTFTPHSIRAAAASWAWRGNVPMATILQQCRWAKESTFTTFYLRRLADTDGIVHRFKPLAVASLL
jgi:hypothetical protein